MRVRLNLVALAVTSMVALAFLFPLANLVDRLAEDRALTLAERDAQLIARVVAISDPGSAETAFAGLTSNGTLSGRDVSLIMIDGRTLPRCARRALVENRCIGLAAVWHRAKPDRRRSYDARYQ